MTLDQLIIELQKLQQDGKGEYVAQAHNVSLNTASGGYYIVNENDQLCSYMIQIDDKNRTITFGEYDEYYSY